LFVLLLSVKKIKKFYKDHKLLEELNTKVMKIHVVAFAGCMLGSAFYDIALLLKEIFPGPDEYTGVKDLEILSLSFFAAMLMLTQALLCAIFW
jgi:hypothetical protein